MFMLDNCSYPIQDSNEALSESKSDGLVKINESPSLSLGSETKTGEQTGEQLAYLNAEIKYS